MENNKKLTPHEQKLYDALKAKGVDVTPHHNDNHKTVDMAILSAKLYIEVDNLDHFTKPDQIIRDLKRAHFSDGDDFRTFYVTNQIIDKYCNEVADALAEVSRRLSANS